jgi:hypothetical protein
VTARCARIQGALGPVRQRRCPRITTFRYSTAAEGSEVDQRPERDDAGREIAELFDHRQLFGEPLGSAGHDRSRVIQEDRDGTEDRAQNEGDRQVVCEGRGQHAHGEQRGAHQPVTQVSGKHQAGIGAAEPAKHHHVTEGE